MEEAERLFGVGRELPEVPSFDELSLLSDDEEMQMATQMTSLVNENESNILSNAKNYYMLSFNSINSSRSFSLYSSTLGSSDDYNFDFIDEQYKS